MEEKFVGRTFKRTKLEKYEIPLTSKQLKTERPDRQEEQARNQQQTPMVA